MSDVLLRNWKPRLVCLLLAIVVWYLVKERAQEESSRGLMPLIPQPMSLPP
jgi:hypothetical protein